MQASRRDLNRLVALGSALAVIGVPIALIASTWQPLEPAQAGDGEESVDVEESQGTEPGNRKRNGRQDRADDNRTPPAQPSD